MKVVHLLQDMGAELQKDLDDDKAVHEKLGCWCETNEKEKTQAIEEGEATEKRLEAEIGEAAAKVKELTEKLKATKDEHDKDWESLKEAEALRMKESKEAHTEEVGLVEAAKACGQAITVLSKHHPELAQVRAAASMLQSARVLSLTRLTGQKKLMLTAFLRRAQSGESFLAVPGYQSYSPQSGQIFGILRQMKEDFEKDLKEAREEEKRAAEEFASLKAAKEEEIAAGKTLVMQLEQEKAKTMQQSAEGVKVLQDTREQLELDRVFLVSLKKKCSEGDGEFDKRVKSRLAEIAAVQDTIKILNSDEAFDTFGKSLAAPPSGPAFLQISTDVAESARRQQAATVIAHVASSVGAPGLSLLLTKVQMDSFKTVKEAIHTMLAELKKQQEDEIAHRDWCIEELHKNEGATAKSDDKKANLETQMADLEKGVETMQSDLDSTKAAVNETKEQMQRSSEVREGEHAALSQSILDQRLTQMILLKAVARMKEVYALLESQAEGEEEPEVGAPHVALSGTHTDPGNGPARFKEYGENSGGRNVVVMLEEIIKDSKTTETDAIVADEDAQSAYESFMKDSNAAVRSYQRKITDVTESVAKAKEQLGMAKSDMKLTMSELESLHETLLDLKKSCDYVMKNFEARQAARTEEVEGLKEAEAILSGMSSSS